VGVGELRIPFGTIEISIDKGTVESLASAQNSGFRERSSGFFVL